MFDPLSSEGLPWVIPNTYPMQPQIQIPNTLSHIAAVKQGGWQGMKNCQKLYWFHCHVLAFQNVIACSFRPLLPDCSPNRIHSCELMEFAEGVRARKGHIYIYSLVTQHTPSSVGDLVVRHDMSIIPRSHSKRLSHLLVPGQRACYAQL